MLAVFISIPIISLIMYLIVAYRTMKDIKKANNTDTRKKLPRRFNNNIRDYKAVEDYYTIRNSLNYP